MVVNSCENISDLYPVINKIFRSIKEEKIENIIEDLDNALLCIEGLYQSYYKIKKVSLELINISRDSYVNSLENLIIKYSNDKEIELSKYFNLIRLIKEVIKNYKKDNNDINKLKSLISNYQYLYGPEYNDNL